MRDVDRKELAIVYENFHRTRSKSLKDKRDNFIDEKDLKQTFAS